MRLILDNAQEQLKVFSWHSFLITSVVQGHRSKPLVILDSFTKIKTKLRALSRILGKNLKGHIFQIQVFKVSSLNPSSDAYISSLLFRRAKQWLFVLTAGNSMHPVHVCWSPYWVMIDLQVLFQVWMSNGFVLTKGGCTAKGFLIIIKAILHS